MGSIFSRKLHQPSFFDKMKLAHACHFTIVIFQIKYCITVLFIAEYNMFNISLYIVHQNSLRPLTSSTN